MLKNTAIQIATSKLASTSLLSGSLFLIGGVVVWQLWRKQLQLQTKTNKLSNEFKEFKQQAVYTNASDNTGSESVVPFSSPQKKDSSTKETSTEKLGLFEYLINDNIQIRQHADN